MNSRFARRITTISFSALLFSIQLVAQNQSNYAVTNLGTLGGTFSSAISISNNGLISGFSFLPGNQTEVAVIWQNGTATPLGTLGGPNSAVEWPNHNATAVVGIAETADLDPLNEDWSCSYGGAFFPTVTGHICLGFVWQHDAMSPLPTLGGINGYASGANDVGQVVGWGKRLYTIQPVSYRKYSSSKLWSGDQIAGKSKHCPRWIAIRTVLRPRSTIRVRSWASPEFARTPWET